jgi:hypothetical protein
MQDEVICICIDGIDCFLSFFVPGYFYQLTPQERSSMSRADRNEKTPDSLLVCRFKRFHTAAMT